MRVFYAVILLNAVVFSRENTYTFIGDYSNREILVALAEHTKRSVVGSNEGLNLVRTWNIDDKRFTIAIDHVRKNLYTDGYFIDVDTACFYLRKIVADTIAPEKEIFYEVFQPNKRKWIVTKNREEYLNAKFEDAKFYSEDSLKKIKRIYSVNLEVLGFFSSGESFAGMAIDKIFNLDFNFYPMRPPTIAFRFQTGYNKQSSNGSFRRQFKIFVSDTNKVHHFGKETRRVNSRIESEKILTEQYESVYDGLTFRLIDSISYYASYRINDVTIEVSGVSDSVSLGSASYGLHSKAKSLLFPSRNTGDEFFNVAVRAKVVKIR